MGGVSIAAFLGGSQVLGVIPKALAKWDIIGKTIGEELQVSTMSDRMNAMFNLDIINLSNQLWPFSAFQQITLT